MTELVTGTTRIPEFSGTVLTPDDPDYDRARQVFNGMVDRRPALIAQCRTAQDIPPA